MKVRINGFIVEGSVEEIRGLLGIITEAVQPTAETVKPVRSPRTKSLKSDVTVTLTVGEDGKAVSFGKLPYGAYLAVKVMAQSVDNKVVYDAKTKALVFKTKKAAAEFYKAVNGHVVTKAQMDKAIADKKSK